MPRDPIPDEVRRFILTSIPSVPFIEALLMFMAQRGREIETREIARGLYVSEPAAADIVRQLAEARIVQPAAAPASHRYSPEPELADMLGQVAAFYSRDLIGVTDLIHSRTSRKAQQFADAFKLRKDS
jgi:DNA-binding Lrp family transcriptional regulator